MSMGLLIARLVLAAVFLTAGVAKLADPKGSRKLLSDFGLPEWLAGPMGWLLPVAELACAILLIPARWAWWGASGVLAMLVLFIAGISISLARGRRPDCHCFGQIRPSPIGWKTVVRNVALAGAAAFVVAQGPGNSGMSVAGWWGELSGFESAVVALGAGLAAVMVFQIWMFFNLLRQNGRLLVRLEAVEAKIGMKGEQAPAGLPVDSPAPTFRLTALEGEPVTLEMLGEGDKAVVLFFSEPGCSACEESMPEVARWQREYSDRLTIVPISRGGAAENRAKTEAHGVRGVLLQTDREVAEAYKVEGTPSAVVVRNGLIASPLALGRDAIRSLVGRATLPKPVKKGELVPSMRLPDLRGNTVDLASLKGRRTLLLFWSPSCGYCKEMLADVTRWEQNPPKNAPELVVISAGSLEDNREQGFRSRVLLDQYFGAGEVFGAGGTPSAVVVDEQGRVASEVSVGVPEVLALAGVVRGRNNGA